MTLNAFTYQVFLKLKKKKWEKSENRVNIKIGPSEKYEVPPCRSYLVFFKNGFVPQRVP